MKKAAAFLLGLAGGILTIPYGPRVALAMFAVTGLGVWCLQKARERGPWS